MNLHILMACATFLLAIMPSHSHAQRIVSLMPSATSILSDIGADSQIVGRTSYCKPPTKGKNIVIGDAVSTNIEAIVGINPDVVIASNFTKPATIEKLKRLGLCVVVLGTPQNLNDIANQTKQLGDIANRPKEANILIEKEKHLIDSIAKSVNPANTNAYVQVGANPTYGATPDYYINDILIRLGMKNILSSSEGTASKETIISRKPNIIIISSMGGLGQSEKEEWGAISNAKTEVIDENVLCCPTMTHFRLSMEMINNTAKD